MSFFLKRPENGVKGDFIFKARFVNGTIIPVHGVCLEPDCHTFGRNYNIRELSNQVYEFMRTNKIPGADREQIWGMINLYTCERLGNDPTYCKQSRQSSGNQTISIPNYPRSKCCGAKL